MKISNDEYGNILYYIEVGDIYKNNLENDTFIVLNKFIGGLSNKSMLTIKSVTDILNFIDEDILKQLIINKTYEPICDRDSIMYKFFNKFIFKKDNRFNEINE